MNPFEAAMRRLLLALLAVCLCSLATGARAETATCPDIPRSGRVSIDLVDGPVNYDFSLGADAMRSMAYAGGSAHAARVIVRGYTKSQFVYSYGSRIATIRLDDGTVCAAPDEILLHIGFNEFDVYVQNEFPQGTCQNTAILEHEHNHVRIFRETLVRRLPMLQSALQSLAASPAYPISGQDSPTARATIEGHISSVIDQEISFVTADQRTLNSQLDSKESIDATTSLCPNW